MLASKKFQFIGSNTNKMLYLISTNQKFLRYMKYLDNDPLDVSKADVTDEDVTGQFVLALFDQNVLEEAKAKVFFHPMDGSLETQPLGYDMFILDIVIPSANWRIEDQGEFRVFLMASEAAKQIDGQRIAGIGQVDMIRWRVYSVGQSYQGLTIWIKVNSTTIK